MSLKLAVLIPNFGRGGAEIFAIEMSRQLKETFDVTVYVESISDNPHASTGLKIKTIKRKLYDPQALSALLQRDSIDIIWSHMSWDNYHVQSLPLLKQQGFTIILTEHSSFWYPYFCAGIGIWGNAEELKAKSLSNLAQIDAVVCVSKNSHIAYEKFLPNSHYIPNYPNPTFYESSKNHIESAVPRIGNVSSFLKPVKRLDLLYKVYSLVSKLSGETELHIAGKVDLTKDYQYRKLFDLGNSRIFLHGEISDVLGFYKRIDLHCFTSQLEGMPTVVLEAAAQGIPTVAFRIPGIEDIIIDQETGVIVDFNDCASMASEIAALLKDTDKLQAMGVAARKFASASFGVKKSSEQYIRLIDKLITAKRHKNKITLSQPAFWDSTKLDFFRKEYLGNLEVKLLSDMLPRCLRSDWDRHVLVSFLIPCYNSIRTIDRAISSINNNYFFDWECVIVDDDSEDDTYTHLTNKYGHLGHFRILKHEQNLGLYQARSTLAKNANGYFIVFLDSDDEICGEALQTSITRAILNNCDVLDTGLLEVVPDKYSSPYPPPRIFNETIGLLSPQEALSAFLCNTIKHSCCGKIYKRKIFLETLPYPHDLGKVNLCEDLIRNSIIFALGCTYSSYTEMPFYKYIRDSDSMSCGVNQLNDVIERASEVACAYGWCIKFITSRLTPSYDISSFTMRQLEDTSWMIETYFKKAMLYEGATFKDMLRESTEVLFELITPTAVEECADNKQLVSSKTTSLSRILVNNLSMGGAS